MKKVNKKNWVLGILLSAILVLGGCSSAKSSDQMMEEAYEPYAENSATTSYDAESQAQTDDLYDSKMAETEMADEAVEPGAVGASGAEKVEVVDPNRKLIKTVGMTVETQEFDSLIANVEQKVGTLGGYIESSNMNGNSEYYDSGRSAYYKVRVPKDKLDTFVESIEGISNITSKNVNTQDVTLQYVDTESYKKSLKAEYQRLIELLEKAQDIETIIRLESRLTEVRYQLQSTESTLRSYDNAVDYATIDLNITEVVRYTPEVAKSPIEKMITGFGESVKNVIFGLRDFLIGLVIVSPYLVLWAIIIGLFVLIIRAMIKSSKKKALKRAELKAQQKVQQDATKDASLEEKQNS